MKKKVFIGLTEIASQIVEFSNGFSKLDIDTITVVNAVTKYNASKSYSFVIDDILTGKEKNRINIFSKIRKRVLRALYKQLVWRKVIDECDIFLFMWSTFLPNHNDIIKLKKRGKKIVVFFVGSDIRWENAMKQEFKKHNLYPIEYKEKANLLFLKRQLRYLRTVEKYADIIYSLPNQSQLSLRPYYTFYYPINLDLYTENCVQKEIPLIVHAPTNPIVKGTKYIDEVIDRLKIEGIEFEYLCLTNIPFDKILEYYSSADILIGQLLAPGGGKQEREALASGAIVLSNMSYENYPQGIPSDCPIIDINKDTLYAKLKAIILNLSFRKELAKKGKPWVGKCHNIEKLVKEILTLLEDPKAKELVSPTFFRHFYIPERNELSLLNKYNKMVSNCAWYKTYVTLGNRDGLIF